MKRYTVIIILKTVDSDFEKVARLFYINIRDSQTITPVTAPNTIRTHKSVRKIQKSIDNDPRNSINIIATELKGFRYTIGKLCMRIIDESHI